MNVSEKFLESFTETEKKGFPCNIKYKANPMGEWEPWLYIPPSDSTLRILAKEVSNTVAQMKEEGRFLVKRVCTVFQGHCVYAFQFLDGREVYLDQL